MEMERIEVKKDLQLGKVLVKVGVVLEAVKFWDIYMVLHHTGWWAVPAEYFEK